MISIMAKHIVLGILLSISFFFSSLASSLIASPWDSYGKGLELLRHRKYPEALRTWLGLFKKRSKLSKRRQLKLSLAMAKVYLHLGKKESAAKLHSFAQRLAPDSESVARLGAEIEERGQLSYEDALEQLDTALLNERVSPGSGREAIEKLLPVFERAVKKRGEKDPRAHYGLGCCLLIGKGDLDEARKELIAAGDYFPAWEKLGEVYRREGKLDEELDCYRRCIEGGKGSARIYSAAAKNLAKRPVDEIDQSEFIDYVEGAIEQDPNYGADISQTMVDGALKSRVDSLVRSARAKLEQERARDRARRDRKRRQRSVTIPKGGKNLDGVTKASP